MNVNLVIRNELVVDCLLVVIGELYSNKGQVESGFQLKRKLDLQNRLLKLQAPW
jgi:hypothetical protein